MKRREYFKRKRQMHFLATDEEEEKVKGTPRQAMGDDKEEVVKPGGLANC